MEVFPGAYPMEAELVVLNLIFYGHLHMAPPSTLTLFLSSLYPVALLEGVIPRVVTVFVWLVFLSMTSLHMEDSAWCSVFF